MTWLPRWLRDRLVRHGLNPAPVAAEVGVGGVTTSSILMQAHAPMVDTCLRLADYLDVSREEIPRLTGYLRPAGTETQYPMEWSFLIAFRRPRASALDELRGVDHCHPSPAMPQHPPDPRGRCPMQTSQRPATSSY
jgi:hypothetical protein